MTVEVMNVRKALVDVRRTGEADRLTVVDRVTNAASNATLLAVRNAQIVSWSGWWLAQR
jgi:hypothetical protein